MDFDLFKQRVLDRLQQQGFVAAFLPEDPEVACHRELKVWASTESLDRPDCLAFHMLCLFTQHAITAQIQSLQISRPFASVRPEGLRIYLNFPDLVRPTPQTDDAEKWRSMEKSGSAWWRWLSDSLATRGIKIQISDFPDVTDEIVEGHEDTLNDCLFVILIPTSQTQSQNNASN